MRISLIQFLRKQVATNKVLDCGDTEAMAGQF